MKRLLLIALCLLIFPWTPCQSAEPIQLARMNPWVAGSVAVTASKSCATDSVVLFDSLSNSQDAYLDIGGSAANYWAGQKGVQFAAETIICKVTYGLRSVHGDTPPVYVYSEVTQLNGTSWGTFSPASCRSSAYYYEGGSINHVFNHGDTCIVPANTNIGFALTGLTDTRCATVWVSNGTIPSTSPSIVGNAATWTTDKYIDHDFSTTLTIMKIEGYAK